MNIAEQINELTEIIKKKPEGTYNVNNCDTIEEPLISPYEAPFYIIVGSPASGKTALWIRMLTNKDNHFWNKRYDKVYVFSGSLNTIEQLDLPENQVFSEVKEDTLKDIIEYNTELLNKDSTHRALIIFDDLVNQLNDKKLKPLLLTLLYNRRHRGMFSVVIITQKFNRLDLKYRGQANGYFIFKPINKKEINSIFDEIVDVDKETFDKITKHTWDKRFNFLFINKNKAPQEAYHKCFNCLRLCEN